MFDVMPFWADHNRLQKDEFIDISDSSKYVDHFNDQMPVIQEGLDCEQEGIGWD